MTIPQTKRTTEAEYLDMDINSEEMLEYFDGYVVVRERWNSFNHSRISSKLVGEISKFLNGDDYSVFPFRLRVADPAGSAYIYPDLAIAGSQIEKKKDCYDTLINPSVIIEVTSEITRERDALKFFHYQKIPSLKEYILVDSTRYHITIAGRHPDNLWQFSTIENNEGTFTIQSINMELPLANIYRKISFCENE